MLFKKKKIALLLAIVILMTVIFAIVGGLHYCNIIQNTSDKTNSVLINDFELKYAENVLTEKLSAPIKIASNKLLYDFFDKPSYLFVYDLNSNWFAIFFRESGELIERGNREHELISALDKKCYYGGINSFFYEEDNKIVCLNDKDFVINKNESLDLLKEYSKSFNEELLENGRFSSLSEMEEYVNNNQFKVVTLAAENRNNQICADNLFYHIGIAERVQIDQGNYCYFTSGNTSRYYGYGSFSRFGSNDEYKDILFPYNINGTCGTIAATALLQYYERNLIACTVPTSFYTNSYQNFYTNANVTNQRQNIVSEKIHNSLNSRHSNGGSGSTYISIKNTINKYLQDYGITSVKAECSAGTVSLASCIDNGNPAIIFVSSCTIYGSNWSGTSYKAEILDFFVGHAMYTYGYTTTASGAVDEYICNAGWSDWGNGEYSWGISYVSKTAVRGNVRIKLL